MIESLLSEKVKKVQLKLRKIIEPDEVLLDCLVSKRILTNEKKSKIMQRVATHEKNDKLIKYLLNNSTDHYLTVLRAFEEAGQKHVANYILAEGGS